MSVALSVVSNPVLHGSDVKAVLDAVEGWPLVKAVQFELDAHLQHGDRYHYEVTGTDGNKMGEQLLFGSGNQPRVQQTATHSFWAIDDINKFQALRGLLVAMHMRGLVNLVYGDPPMPTILARVSAGPTPTFAYQSGFASVTHVSTGVHELTLVNPVDWTTTGAIFPSVINAAGAEVGISIVSPTVFHVITNNHLSGNPEDDDFFVRVDM